MPKPKHPLKILINNNYNVLKETLWEKFNLDFCLLAKCSSLHSGMIKINLGVTSKPNCRLTGRSAFFRAVVIVKNKQ